MKTFSALFLSMVFLFLFCKNITAQVIHFDFTDGTSEQYDLYLLQNITYSDEQMHLLQTDGNTVNLELDLIKKYYYIIHIINVEENFAKIFDVQVYPNPATDFITLKFNNQVSDKFEIELFDLRGRKVKSEFIENTFLNQNQIDFNLQSFNPGIYLMRFNSNEFTVTKRIIIL